jgi:UDP-N-acetylmuramoyl-tripeptide--D-alanyl-D-alanine ligase
MKTFLKSVVVKILIVEASWLLKRHKPTIVAITGSVGKTTTKDAIYAAVKNSVSARKSEKSFNSEIGVPLTVLGLRNGWNNPFLWIKNIIDGFFIALHTKDYPSVLILETGIDRPGDMERLTTWLKPDVVVLTRLPSVPVHVEFFPTPQDVIDEKMKLVAALKPEGILIYNQDDAIIESQLPLVLQKCLSFSRYLPSDFHGDHDRTLYADDRAVGMVFTLKHSQESFDITIKNTIGSQQVYACTAAIAVAQALGIPVAEAAESIQELSTPNGRMRIVPGIKSTTIIDDTYNSSPVAAEQALQTLAEVLYANRKIAVLGDMLELGRFSSEEHEKLGQLAAKTATNLITVGVRARKIAEGALEMGLDEANILQYEDADQAGRELQNMLQPGDVVLVKASQGVRLERVVEEIMAHPELAADLLVRQDDEWLQIK